MSRVDVRPPSGTGGADDSDIRALFTDHLAGFDPDVERIQARLRDHQFASATDPFKATGSLPSGRHPLLRLGLATATAAAGLLAVFSGWSDAGPDTEVTTFASAPETEPAPVPEQRIAPSPAESAVERSAPVTASLPSPEVTNPDESEPEQSARSTTTEQVTATTVAAPISAGPATTESDRSGSADRPGSVDQPDSPSSDSPSPDSPSSGEPSTSADRQPRPREGADGSGSERPGSTETAPPRPSSTVAPTTSRPATTSSPRSTAPQTTVAAPPRPEPSTTTPAATSTSAVPTIPPNAVPSVSRLDDQASSRGDAVSLQVVAVDGDGDALTFSAWGLPPGLSIDTRSGVIAGTITDDGEYRATVTVEDPGGATDSIGFAWSVTRPRPNCEKEPWSQSQWGGFWPRTLRVYNDSGESIEAFWVDHGGDRVSAGTLENGSSGRLTTYRDHVWVFASADDGRCLYLIDDPDYDQWVTVR
jgi:hypothetical protein